MVDLFVLAAFTLSLNFSFFYITTYVNVEVHCTQPSPSVRVPCLFMPSIFGGLNKGDYQSKLLPFEAQKYFLCLKKP